ncbi:hypothetical protein TVAG_110710 [Trichomonas vaginalis G3]|uniref:Uncharacterized protein n=1 Tax=Trichomonas vaginalis (strain ATCC PRA-98 / G3) TaxID=412133 RepID=A2DGS1_TRIV3|nr:hypothetical protein TVAGG3_0997320 [Trichomonas vaginalis G3]EAY20458.1 hypothetical protein TVAG_110710 [Trichomonas vaginalis G3]KAI5490492.1 hypothetical protein TVAGG3_0997320 [Trichomonas vaginalis G3]|eukprot:XP_001581444.1 hypothetical protein [Trichomonas vaginalis G3]
MTELKERNAQAIKKKIAEAEKKNDDLRDKIENETQKNNILILLQSEYEKMRDDFLEEEQKNLLEIQNLSLDVKNVKKLVPDKKSYDLHDNNLEEGEQALMNEIEKMEAANYQFDRTQSQLNSVSQKLKDLTPVVDQLEIIVLKYESISKSLTKVPSYYITIEDLETELQNLRTNNPIRKQNITKKIDEIKNLEMDNSLKMLELRRNQAKLDGTTAEITVNESNLASVIVELQNWNIELQKSNLTVQAYKEDALTQVIKEIDENNKVIADLRKRLEEIQNENKDFPRVFKEIEANDARSVGKKKQLVTELTRKINETKSQILRSNSMSEEVMALTVKMEEEWTSQQELSDKCAALTKELYDLKEYSDRKSEILELLKDLASKEVRKNVGIKSLEQLYDVAAEQNRLLSRQNKMVEVEFEKAQNELASLS